MQVCVEAQCIRIIGLLNDFYSVSEVIQGKVRS